MQPFSRVASTVDQIDKEIITHMVPDSKNMEDLFYFINEHIFFTNKWFKRISCSNKKKYLLLLLEDMKNVCAIALLLRSTWSCQTKDAVMSVSENPFWSNYDRIPFDNNRTATSPEALATAMKDEHQLFLTLNPEAQAFIISDLGTMSGGAVIRAIYERAYELFIKYNTNNLEAINDKIVGVDRKKLTPKKSKSDIQLTSQDTSTKEKYPKRNSKTPPYSPQKDFDEQIEIWNLRIHRMYQSLRLEEMDIVLKDGTEKTFWKVFRPKLEHTETVDLIQLLPSGIGKKILSYLPVLELNVVSRVNKYWAYLVRELREESLAIDTIKKDIMKLQKNIEKFANILETKYFISQTINSKETQTSSCSIGKNETNIKRKIFWKGSLVKKSLKPKIVKPVPFTSKPIRNIACINEYLDQRGAVDETLWKWCKNIPETFETIGRPKNSEQDQSKLFNKPIDETTLRIPLRGPLVKDRSHKQREPQPKPILCDTTILNETLKSSCTKYSFWPKDLSDLYPVTKISSNDWPLNIL